MMDFLKSLGDRFFKNPKTTMGGLAIGTIAAGIFQYVMVTQAGCHFEDIQIGQALIFAVGLITGGTATDNGKGV